MDLPKVDFVEIALGEVKGAAEHLMMAVNSIRRARVLLTSGPYKAPKEHWERAAREYNTMMEVAFEDNRAVPVETAPLLLVPPLEYLVWDLERILGEPDQWLTPPAPATHEHDSATAKLGDLVPD